MYVVSVFAERRNCVMVWIDLAPILWRFKPRLRPNKHQPHRSSFTANASSPVGLVGNPDRVKIESVVDFTDPGF